MSACPCCGRPLLDAPKEVGFFLPPVQRRIYDLVRRSMPNGIEVDALYERIYGRHERSRNTLSVNVYWLNQTLHPRGMRVFCRHGVYYMRVSGPDERTDNQGKLREEDIPAIRLDKRTNSRIAHDYGVTRNAIWLVKNRLTWKHVQ